MPDKVRSVDDMVRDMERAVEEPEGNTSGTKHRQHVAHGNLSFFSSTSMSILALEGVKTTKFNPPSIIMNL